MPPTKHAKLSPSAAERWLACPASIRMESQVPKEAESSYAREGTAAHALAELKARREFLGLSTEDFQKGYQAWLEEFADLLTDDVVAEMERHTDAYILLIDERLAEHPHSQLMLEQRLSSGIDECEGTSDTVIVSTVHVEIIDFKYGQGVAVEAKGNPQLRIYGLGALETYGDLLGETQEVRMTVHQPRLDHILTETLTPGELRAWREEIRPIAEEALHSPNPRFGPSETACRWCPASGRCRAQLEQVFEEDFDEDPTTLSPEEMAKTYARLPRIREWLKAFEEAALSMAYSEGTPIPGYKVVLSGGQRKITEPEGALDCLEEHGYDFDEVGRRSIRGIGELEKLLGKDLFADLLAPYITKSEGRPSLVVETDKRPAIDPSTEAQKDFGKELI